MLWMERLALMFYISSNVVLFGFLFMLKHTGSVELQASDFTSMFWLGVFLTLFVWAIFRAIDFSFGGPLRRQVKREQYLNSLRSSNDYHLNR